MEKRELPRLSFMAEVPGLMNMAKKVGLKAEYIPIVDAVEFLYLDIPMGITFNAKHFKPYKQNRFYNLERYLKTFNITKFIEKV
jgi:hypothetical protein